jgi:hypothetical protein
LNGNEFIYSWITGYSTAVFYCKKKLNTDGLVEKHRTNQNNFTQALYPMNNKAIISLISFFLLSMFYVAPASAGPTYVNIVIPTECGAWNYNAAGSHHCAGTGNGKRVKAGRNGSFKCVGGGNGRGNLVIEMSSCPTVVFDTFKKGSGWATSHYVSTKSRTVVCRSGCPTKRGKISIIDAMNPVKQYSVLSDRTGSLNNTKEFEIVPAVRYCTGGRCESNPGRIWN